MFVGRMLVQSLGNAFGVVFGSTDGKSTPLVCLQRLTLKARIFWLAWDAELAGNAEGGLLLPGHGRGIGGGGIVPGREVLPGGALAHGRDHVRPQGGSHERLPARGRVSEGGIPVLDAVTDLGTGRVIGVTGPGSATAPLLGDLPDPHVGGGPVVAAVEPAVPPGEGAHLPGT